MISIVIPTFNEAENIAGLVAHLKRSVSTNLAEIIVCDGGSADNTLAVALDAGARAILSAKKGRAAQMNCGASVATGNILYFLHADTLPPNTLAPDIEKAVASGYSLGRYRTRFDSNRIVLKVNAFFTRFDWFICYGGDQTLFMTKDLFNAIGGFNEQLQIMEDYEIVARARKHGKYKILNGAATVSARKYNTNSWLKVQMANRTIVKMYKRGASQQDMVKKYKELLVYR